MMRVYALVMHVQSHSRISRITAHVYLYQDVDAHVGIRESDIDAHVGIRESDITDTTGA